MLLDHFGLVGLVVGLGAGGFGTAVGGGGGGTGVFVGGTAVGGGGGTGVFVGIGTAVGGGCVGTATGGGGAATEPRVFGGGGAAWRVGTTGWFVFVEGFCAGKTASGVGGRFVGPGKGVGVLMGAVVGDLAACVAVALPGVADALGEPDGRVGSVVSVEVTTDVVSVGLAAFAPALSATTVAVEASWLVAASWLVVPACATRVWPTSCPT